MAGGLGDVEQEALAQTIDESIGGQPVKSVSQSGEILDRGDQARLPAPYLV